MRKWLSLLLILLPLTVWADDLCFDFSAWKKALIAGDSQQVSEVLEQAFTACSCQSESDKCIILPGQSLPTTSLYIKETAERILKWRQEIMAACGNLPETEEGDRKMKAECYSTRGQAFSEGLQGERFGTLFSPIPVEIANNFAERFRQSNQGSVNQSLTLEQQYGREAATIGRQICSLNERLRDQEIQLDQVRRRGHFAPAEKHRREAELIESIRQLREMVSDLREKFQKLTGESFDPFAICSELNTQ